MESATVPAPQHPRARRRGLRGASDERLVARVRAGDDGAFEVLYDRYHAGLLGFCRHMLGSREEAEDALQHTFMQAYRGLRRDGRDIRLKAWLYTIARNRCLTVLRARRDQVSLDDAEPAVEGLAAEVGRRADLRDLVADLQRLPEDQRAALVLFEMGDTAHDDIAAVLGVRRQKVKALVFQAREALMQWRTARETPCQDVREQLATLTGSGLRRGAIRRHVEQCPGCQAFEAEVRRQRAALAVVLPVVPALGLKASVLGAVLGGGAAAAQAGSAAAVGAGATGLALGAKGAATKLLVAAAVAGGAGGAGYVAVDQIDKPSQPASEQRAVPATPADPGEPGDRTRAIPAIPATPAAAAAAAEARRERARERRAAAARKARAKREAAAATSNAAAGKALGREASGKAKAKALAKGKAKLKKARKAKKARPTRVKKPRKDKTAAAPKAAAPAAAPVAEPAPEPAPAPEPETEPAPTGAGGSGTTGKQRTELPGAP